MIQNVIILFLKPAIAPVSHDPSEIILICSRNTYMFWCEFFGEESSRNRIIIRNNLDMCEVVFLMNAVTEDQTLIMLQEDISMTQQV